MAQINQKVPTIRTHEGAPAKRINSEEQLRRLVMASLLWEKQFYIDGVEHAQLVKQAVENADPAVVAQIAIEAREQGKLRHMPLLLARELARTGSLKAETLERIIQRADELSEFMALYWQDGKQPIAKQVKKGLASAFRKFDEYALAKYNRDKSVKLRDVMFMVRPKPKDDEQAALWKRLAEDKLQTPDTWEVALSSGADKRETWNRLITERKLGGLATLRNLRNMIYAGVSRPTIREAIAQANYNRVLPFRFIAAARYAEAFEPELEAKMFEVTEGMPKLTGETIVLADHSGSMHEALSSKSDMRRWDAAAALAMIAREVCENVRVFVFSGNGWGRESPLGTTTEVAPRRGFALRDAMTDAMGWGGTDLGGAVRYMNSLGYDRLIVISDEQSATPVPDPVGRAYMINVAAFKNGVGYGKWLHADGFSENVFAFMEEYERSYGPTAR